MHSPTWVLVPVEGLHQRLQAASTDGKLVSGWEHLQDDRQDGGEGGVESVRPTHSLDRFDRSTVDRRSRPVARPLACDWRKDEMMEWAMSSSVAQCDLGRCSGGVCWPLFLSSFFSPYKGGGGVDWVWA